MPPLLSVEDFRQVIGMHPWHFWGLADPQYVPQTAAASDLLYQYGWQSVDRMGRDDIVQALARAESLMARELGYSIAPQYRVDTIRWPTYYAPGLRRTVPATGEWRRLAVRLPARKVISIGVETLTLLEADAAIAWTDLDGDGLSETGTVAVATTITEAARLRLYFAAADRFDGSGVGERWRIWPVTARFAGGVATLRFKRWQAVRPVLYEGVKRQPLSPAEDANFATHLDVYSYSIDPDGETVETAQATLTWETLPQHGCWCCCSTCLPTSPADSAHDPAAIAMAIARVGVRDPELGWVTPAEAVRDATSGIWSDGILSGCWEPDRVTVRWLGGQALDAEGLADPQLRSATVRLAAAELAREAPGHDVANRELARWQFDLARTGGANDEVYGALAADSLRNPFGTRRGHLAAWQEVSRVAPGQGLHV